jgi:hypothetical protein
MKKFKVLMNFIRLSIWIKIAYYRNILNKMTKNVNFINPDVNLETVKTALDETEIVANGAKDGSRTQIAIRNNKMAIVDGLFHTLALYVERIANGDETIIMSSGFDVLEVSRTYNRPELSVKSGDVTGNIKLIAKAMEGAKSYIWQYAKDTQPLNGDGWILAGYSTKTIFELSNLEHAGKYWFRVAGITANGLSNYTAPVMKVIE